MPYELGTQRDENWRVKVFSSSLLTIKPPEANFNVLFKKKKLLSILLRCGTKLYEWGTQWDSNSLVNVC